ncbi:hypothetical protein [Streptococcus pseudoporcinus]|nr:hypothetical protein [Streptococcus pseudoporcinus]
MVLFVDCQNYWLTLPHHTKKNLLILSRQKKPVAQRLLARDK